MRQPDVLFDRLTTDVRGGHRLDYAGPHRSEEFDCDWVEDVVAVGPRRMDVRVLRYDDGRSVLEWTSRKNVGLPGGSRDFLFWTLAHQPMQPDVALDLLRTLLCKPIEVSLVTLLGQVIAKRWTVTDKPAERSGLLKSYAFNR